MTIDVWMQHPTRRFLADDMFASLRRWTGQEVPSEEIPLEATVAAMDQAQIDMGLLSAWHGPDSELISNDEVADWIAARPDRFAGLATARLDKPMDAVRELRRCVTDLGFRGLRIVPWLWQLAPTDRRYYPLYAACVELGIPFCTQVGHTGPLRPSETGRPIPYIDQIALDFPELAIVCGHVGYPWTEEMIAVARKHPNVYIDTSAYTSARLPQELTGFLHTRTGSHKVLFGTNYPMISHTHALADLDDLGLDTTTRQLYLHDNAARLFGLAASSSSSPSQWRRASVASRAATNMHSELESERAERLRGFKSRRFRRRDRGVFRRKAGVLGRCGSALISFLVSFIAERQRRRHGDS